MAVQIIKATKQPQGTVVAADRGKEKIRVCAYARISTDSDAQETSYEAQCRHYTDYIMDNPEWEFAGVYADEGISGTSTKNREQFLKMIHDCEAGQIDMILTKSISRWARNTVDSLRTIRKLKDLGVGVLFEKENIFTLDAKGEVLITIMSSIAQQESDSISRNVRLGIQYLMQQGKGRLNTRQFLGLTKGGEHNDTLEIVPGEADLVRRIYREYLEGFSPGMIARRLTQEKIPTPAGKVTWYQSTIVSILENEKYCGDLLMQKYYVEDFLTHRIVRNTGQLPQYFVEDNHEPIVPKKIFYQVQGEMQRRSLLKREAGKLRFGSADALKGRLVCGCCGRILKRYIHPDHKYTDWRCRYRAYEKRSMTREVSPGCPCRNVPEADARNAVISAFNKLPTLRDRLIRMQGSLWNGDLKRIDVMLEHNREQRKRMDSRLEQLLAEPQMEESDEIRFLRNEIGQLETERISLVLERAEAANREIHIRLALELLETMKALHDAPYGLKMRKNVEEESPACHEYDEFFSRTKYIPEEGVLDRHGWMVTFSDDLVVRYLENMTVLEEGYEVKFKCGLSVRTGL